VEDREAALGVLVKVHSDMASIRVGMMRGEVTSLAQVLPGAPIALSRPLGTSGPEQPQTQSSAGLDNQEKNSTRKSG
jgi:hypothetical protein